MLKKKIDNELMDSFDTICRFFPFLSAPSVPSFPVASSVTSPLNLSIGIVSQLHYFIKFLMAFFILLSICLPVLLVAGCWYHWHVTSEKNREIAHLSHQNRILHNRLASAQSKSGTGWSNWFTLSNVAETVSTAYKVAQTVELGARAYNQYQNGRQLAQKTQTLTSK